MGFKLLIFDVRMKVLLPHLTLPQLAAAEKGKLGDFGKSSMDLFKKLELPFLAQQGEHNQAHFLCSTSWSTDL